MGKNKGGKTSQQVPPAPKKEEKIETIEPEVINKPVVEVLDVTKFMEKLNAANQEGLSPEGRVKMLEGLDRHFMQPNAAEKTGMSEEAVKKINKITAFGWVTTLACEASFGKNPFALTLNRNQLLEIAEVGKEIGITFDQKLLTGPSETVTLKSEEIKVAADTKKALKKEKELVESTVETDPTKIKNEEELKTALLYIMANRNNMYSKIADSIAFYRAYLGVQAEKAEDKKAAHEAVSNKSNTDILKEIRTLLGTAPIVVNGVGRSMSTITSRSKSPIPAFIMLRESAKNKKTGVPAIDDTDVADYVKFLVEWAMTLQIESYKAKIKEHEKNLEVLSKDEKANAEGIKSVNEAIAQCNSNIEHTKEIIFIVNNADGEVADNLLVNLNDKDLAANRIFKDIEKSYYSDIDTSAVDVATLKHNIQQYAGIITNMFRPSADSLLAYSEANILEFQEKKETTEEPKK